MRILLLTILLTACGAQDKTNNEQEVVTSPVTQPAGMENNQVRIATSIPGQEVVSYAVALQSDLKTCSVDILNQLVYVTSEKTFYVCNKTWQAIDMSSLAGKNGVDGKNGNNGKDGVNGSNGTDGKDGQIVSGGMWYDPISKKYWTIGATYNQNPGTVCNGDWKVPTQDEISQASSHGMAIAASQNGGKPCGIYATFSAQPVTSAANSTMCNQQINQGVYCIQK